MTTAAEKVLAEKAEKNPGVGVNAGEKTADKTAVTSAVPASSGAPPVDKRRALGRGLESLLGGPRIVGPGVAPPVVLLFLTKTRLLLRRLLRPLFHRSLRRRTVRGMSLTPVRMSSET